MSTSGLAEQPVEPRAQAAAAGGPARARRRNAVLALALIVAGALVAGWLVYARLIVNGPQPGWDEAAHALQGMLIARDLAAGDWSALLFDSYRQVYWPPVHSWLVATAFLVAGPSLEAARLVSTVAYVCLAPTLFLLARTLRRSHGTVAGTVAAALALATPGVIGYATQSMLELPGLLALSATALVVCRLAQRPDAPASAHLLIGLGIMLTYLVKSNYGILLMLSLALTRLIEVRGRSRALFTRQNFYALLPILVIGALWFADPSKIARTWSALVNQPWGGEEGRGIAGVLFYPLAIARIAGSAWMFFVLLGGFLVGTRVSWRSGGLLLVVLAALQLLIGVAHHTKVTRHILPMFPALFILTGVAAAYAWERLSARARAFRAAAVAFVVAVVLLQARVIANARLFPAARAQVEEVLGYVGELAGGGRATLVLGTFHARPGPPNVDWYLAARARVLPVTASGAAMEIDREREMAERAEQSEMPRWLRARALRVLGRYDDAGDVRSLHLGVPRPVTQRDFEDALHRMLSRHSPRAIVALVSTVDTVPYTHEFVAPVLGRAGFREASVRDFTEARVRVYLFEWE